MATTTFSGVVRSAGGDDRKATTPGTVQLVLPFYIADPTAANTTAVARSATDTRSVILPANAIITEVIANAAGTGGTDPTFDMGWIGIDDATALNVDGIIAEGDADVGKSVFNYATATSGAELGDTMSTAQPVRITGGVGASAATGGVIDGYIVYHLLDSGAWSS